MFSSIDWMNGMFPHRLGRPAGGLVILEMTPSLSGDDWKLVLWSSFNASRAGLDVTKKEPARNNFRLFSLGAQDHVEED